MIISIIIITFGIPLLAVVSFLIFGAIVNHSVNKLAKERCYSSVDEIPYRRVGLLLGTVRLTKNGNENVYFTYRIKACAELYKSGKVSHFLVSGDNCRRSYNEPEDMRNALVEQGVPFDSITLDYAGFRTYDSMVRASKVFGLDSVTVISQGWHNARAVYIGRRVGLDAIAFNAKDVTVRRTSVKFHIREWFARTKMAIDLLLMRDPHFLGDPIEI